MNDCITCIHEECPVNEYPCHNCSVNGAIPDDTTHNYYSPKADLPKSMRKQILDEAEKCVCHDRNDQYGSPENNFRTIAKLWNTYLGMESGITATDVAMMMALLKIARISTGQKTKDSFVDLAGYAACGAECVDKGE